MLKEAVKTKAQLIDELYHIEKKAEIVNGEIVIMSPTGAIPSRTSGLIYGQLFIYEEGTDRGYAFPNNVGYIVDLPNRDSFSPDASFYTGEVIDEDFLDGAPIFAAEVRSKWDYGKHADGKIKAKIADYFATGTQVVWDVDVLREKLIRVYRATDPEHPTIYRAGDVAEAEPALPGWQVKVDEIFR